MVLQYKLKRESRWKKYPGKDKMKIPVSKCDFRLLNEAKTKIAEANALLSLSIDELSTENRTTLRTLAQDTQTLLKNAHQSLNDAIKSLRDALKMKVETTL